MIDAMRDNPGTAAGIFIAILFALVIQVYVANTVVQLHNNICTAVAQSGKGNTALFDYWTKAAGRAKARAIVDTGSLRQADLDAADEDNHIAAVFAPHPGIKFPGC